MLHTMPHRRLVNAMLSDSVGVQAKTGRQINKIVQLPLENDGTPSVQESAQEVTRPIHVHCTADAFDLKMIANALKKQYPSAEVHSITECVHCCVHHADFAADPSEGVAEMFFFQVRPLPRQPAAACQLHQWTLTMRVPDSSTSTSSQIIHCCRPACTATCRAGRAVTARTQRSIHANTGSPVRAPLVQYGVSIFWGMSERKCEHALSSIARPAQLDALDPDEHERDNFTVCYAPVQQSRIANDQITIPLIFSGDWSIKLAISHALAQSTKLCLYEDRMGDLVNETKEMPDHLAKTGKARARSRLSSRSGSCMCNEAAPSRGVPALVVSEHLCDAPAWCTQASKRAAHRLGDEISRTKRVCSKRPPPKLCR